MPAHIVGTTKSGMGPGGSLASCACFWGLRRGRANSRHVCPCDQSQGLRMKQGGINLIMCVVK